MAGNMPFVLTPGRYGDNEPTFFRKPETQRALESLASGPITVVVGAGASAEAGFPTWATLLRTMLDQISSADGDENVGLLKSRLAQEAEPMTQAALIEEFCDGRAAFVKLLASSLFVNVDEFTRPGPTARAVARLYLQENPAFSDDVDAQCHLATTNFDLLLEVALREQLMLRKRAGLPGRGFDTKVYSHCGREPQLQISSPIVRHLHGCIPGAHEAFYVPSGSAGRDAPVITAIDFMSDGDPWFEKFLHDRMKTDHLLFVGASLTDQHLVRSLLQAHRPQQRSIVALIPRDPRTGNEPDVWRGHDPTELKLEAAKAEMWRRSAATVLFPDWYVQVGQFIEELLELRSCTRSNGEQIYAPYEERLSNWFTWFSTKKLYQDEEDQSIDAFRARQVELNGILRGWISGGPSVEESTEADIGEGVASERSAGDILSFVAEIVGESEPGYWTRRTEEVLAVHLWTRIPMHDDHRFRRHRELAMTASSDRVWQHPLAVESRRITFPTKRIAIQTFIAGYTQFRNTCSRDYQWNFLAAAPIRLRGSVGRPPLVVGSLCIQSSHPWTYDPNAPSMSGSRLIRKHDRSSGSLKYPQTPFESVRGQAVPVSILRLAHERWLVSRGSKGHRRGSWEAAPLEQILLALSKSATRIVDPEPDGPVGAD